MKFTSKITETCDLPNNFTINFTIYFKSDITKTPFRKGVN